MNIRKIPANKFAELVQKNGTGYVEVSHGDNAFWGIWASAAFHNGAKLLSPMGSKFKNDRMSFLFARRYT